MKVNQTVCCLQRGITLVELLMAVIIVTLLAVVSYPSYVDYVVKVKRKQGMADLMAISSSLERYRAVHVSYQGADDNEQPLFHDWSPADRPKSDKNYAIELVITEDGRSYTLTAIPVPGKSQAEDGQIRYFSDGLKAWDADNNGFWSQSEYAW